MREHAQQCQPRLPERLTEPEAPCVRSWCQLLPLLLNTVLAPPSAAVRR